MLYVGLTDNQKESVEFFANVLRGQLSLQHKISLPRVGNLAVKASTEKSKPSPVLDFWIIFTRAVSLWWWLQGCGLSSSIIQIWWQIGRRTHRQPIIPLAYKVFCMASCRSVRASEPTTESSRWWQEEILDAIFTRPCSQKYITSVDRGERISSLFPSVRGDTVCCMKCCRRSRIGVHRINDQRINRIGLLEWTSSLLCATIISTICWFQKQTPIVRIPYQSPLERVPPIEAQESWSVRASGAVITPTRQIFIPYNPVWILKEMRQSVSLDLDHGFVWKSISRTKCTILSELEVRLEQFLMCGSWREGFVPGWLSDV